MGNWSGKRKPKNKLKRKVKAEKRIERKADEEVSDSDEQTEAEEPASKRGGAVRPAAVSARPAAAVAVAQGGFASLRRKWDGLPPQVRIGTLLGLVAVAAVGLYRFIETRPTADVGGGRTPVAATAATTLPPIPLGTIPGMSGGADVAPIALPFEEEPSAAPEAAPAAEPTAAPKPAPVRKPMAPKPTTAPAPSPQVDPSNPY